MIQVFFKHHLPEILVICNDDTATFDGHCKDVDVFTTPISIKNGDCFKSTGN
jgi:hypothetical protein